MREKDELIKTNQGRDERSRGKEEGADAWVGVER